MLDMPQEAAREAFEATAYLPLLLKTMMDCLLDNMVFDPIVIQLAT